MSFITLSGRTVKGVAFDMDGTLIDCEPSNRSVVQKATGTTFEIDWLQCAGKKEEVILEWMKTKYGADKVQTSKDVFLAACQRGYEEAISDLQPRLGMMDILRTFKELSIPVIIVTNTETEMAKRKLSQCGMLEYMFDIIGSDTIKERGLRAKPSGDGYREAAKILGITEHEMLGFEDSTTGMTALAETDALSVHITDYGTPEHLDAHIVIGSNGTADLVSLNNQIRRENYHRILHLTPEPSCPTYA